MCLTDGYRSPEQPKTWAFKLRLGRTVEALLEAMPEATEEKK
jgi:hypothetical protein